jgi:hypothetical protein
MDGALTPEETPGGGLTMVVSLITAGARLAQGEPGQRERAGEHVVDPVMP